MKKLVKVKNYRKIKKLRVIKGRAYTLKNGAGSRNFQFLTQYGLDRKTYEIILEIQNYKCLLCDVKHEEKKWKRLSVDHNHTTGKVRGLLCRNCNWALGHIKDNKETALRMHRYLERDENRE